MKKNFLILFFALSSIISFAQDSNLGNWLIYFGNKKINDRLNWHHELQYRNYNLIGDLEQVLLRTGLGYNLTENNNNILIGYAFIHSQNYLGFLDEKIRVNEQRIYQQFITKQSIGRVQLQHRYRFEQRWVETQDFKLRFRYFLSINIPLNNKIMEDKTVYLSSYNEIFINNKATVFDRNRLYGGIGYKVNALFRVEVGYMNQFLNNNTGRDQLNIITFFNF